MSPTIGNPSDGDAELQRKKLLLEIRELKRPWWQKAAYIAALSPVFLGLLTVYVGYQTGYFNALSERLTAQRQVLEFDVKDFARQKDEVAVEVKRLTSERNSISAENAKLKRETQKLSAEMSNLEQRLALAPLQADLNQMIELTSRTLTVADVQKWVSATIGIRVHPGVAEAFDRISKNLAAKDRFQKQRIALLKTTIDQQMAHQEVLKLLRAAAAHQSIESVLSQ